MIAPRGGGADFENAVTSPNHAWEQYRFCPRCGHAYGDASLERPPTMLRCDNCGYEFYQHSSLAATAVIPSSDGRVLLVTRGKDPGKGLLALAGGFLEYDERPDLGAMREVSEEIQHPVEIDRLLATYLVAYQYRGALVSVVEMVFLAKPVEGQWNFAGTDEVTGIAYYDSEDVLDGTVTLAFPEQRQSLVRFRDERRRLSF